MNGAETIAPPTPGIAAASEAAARVAELRSLIQTVETGEKTGSFSDALAEASAVEAAPELGEATAVTSPSTTTSALATTIAGEAAQAVEAEGGGAVPYQSLIEEACAKYGIESSLLAGLIEQESHFQADVGSGAGAQGLTELMPETAASLGVTDPHDPTQSIFAGAQLLSEKLTEFGGDKELALAAYNAGSGAVQQYDGIPPYPETQEYVKKVLGYAAGYASDFGGVA